jgi:hypothetical protein
MSGADKENSKKKTKKLPSEGMFHLSLIIETQKTTSRIHIERDESSHTIFQQIERR